MCDVSQYQDLALYSYGFAHVDSNSGTVIYRKQIKNRLRNRLQPSSLSKLMMIAIEGPQLDEVDFDAVLSLWKIDEAQTNFVVMQKY